MVADALWLLTARSRGGQHWLDNARCEIQAIDIAGQSHPVSLLDHSSWQESYVSSPRSTWLRYPRQEMLRQLNPSLVQLARLVSCILSSPLSALLTTARLDQAAIVANHLVSTNLHPEWSVADIDCMTEKLLASYPQRPFLVRNICPQVNPQLTQALQTAGWQLLPSRMIYLCDPQQASVWKHNHVKQDARLLADGKVEVIPHHALQAEDLAQLRQLFRQLFIDKHSYLNPDFSPAFFELCLETQFLELLALRCRDRIVGVLGLYANPDTGWITTPLIGYDTSLPQELGLYRRLMALLLRQAREKQLKLHYSSGASQFKRARGGTAHLEYTAIFNRHLPFVQNCSSTFLYKLINCFAPAILRRADGI